jgi:hypothetical protein
MLPDRRRDRRRDQEDRDEKLWKGRVWDYLASTNR